MSRGGGSQVTPVIGTLTEQPLHQALKRHYAGQRGQTEARVDGYIIDVLVDGLLVEIQTGHFSAVKRKIHQLCRQHTVKLVYPVAVEKWLIDRQESAAAPERKRKSPKHGQPIELFTELVSMPTLMLEPRFALEVVLIEEEEIRLVTEEPLRRRKKVHRVERRLVRVLGQRCYRQPQDLLALLPPNLPERFTTADLAAACLMRKDLSQKMVYCLRQMGLLQQVGKQNRYNLYQKSEISQASSNP